MEKPHLDPTINYGHLIQTTLLVIAGVTFIITQAQWKTDVDSALRTISEFQKNAGPAITTIQVNDKLQDERIANVDKKLEGILNAQQKTVETLGEISTSIAVIEERSKKSGETN